MNDILRMFNIELLGIWEFNNINNRKKSYLKRY